MNLKKILFTIMLVYLTQQLLNYLLHILILGSTYASLPHLWRQDVLNKIWIRLVTDLIFSIFFVYLFVRGYQNRGVKEGIRFGIIVACLYAIPIYYGQYIIYPLPSLLIVEWVFFGFITYMILGVVCAMFYKGGSRRDAIQSDKR